MRVTAAALALLLLPSAARALPDNIWDHIETACSAGQVPIKNATNDWTCGAPVASSVASGGVDFSTITLALAGKLSTTTAVPSALIDLSTVTTALATKLSNTAAVPAGLIDLSTVTTALATKLSNTAAVPTALIDLSTVTTALAAKLTQSTATIANVSGGSFSTGLSNGTTFQSFIPDAAISLRRVCATVAIAGVGGSGDTIRCNNAAGDGISVTLGAAAAAGTTACATGTAAIAYQAQVFCHLDTGAVTMPLFNMNLEYVIP